MEHAEEVIRELTEFATTTARTMQNHRDQLQRHEEILAAQFKAGTSHQEMIQLLRTDVQSLGDLVNSQSQLIISMQKAMIKILRVLDLPTPEDVSGAVN